MAASRARPKKADPLDERLLESVRASLDLARRAADDATEAAPALKRSPARRKPAPVILAYSGGRDSSALLDLLARIAAERGSGLREVVAVHVHHGLSPHADEWLAHCEAEAGRQGATFVSKRVTVRRRGQGIEAAAREARYAALAEAAYECGASLVFSAHHRDDRLETFLLQWLRGAGLEGLAAFPAMREFGADGAQRGLRLIRPLIDVERADIERYVEHRGLRYVEDDSNADLTLARNAVRAEILPRLESIRSGYRASAARSVELVAEAAEALRAIAQDDLLAVTRDAPAGMLRLDALFELPATRRTWVLRAWLAEQGVETPSRARLLELLEQARTARSDARLLIRVGAREVRRHRGLLLLRDADSAERIEEAIVWRGEDSVAVPAWGGVLYFDRTEEEGFEPDWLAAEPLALRPRAGGERFKPNAARPSKTLKRLFQDAGVPEFARARLPLVWRGDDLIYVAGLGPDVRFTERDGERITLRWLPDATLLES
ncbi:MAG: tRNA lysidine(34) synthetase TilS [Burkholderiaceae bacterium]